MVGIISYDIKNDKEFIEALKQISKITSSRFVFGEAARIIKKFSKANFTLKGSGQYPPLSERYKKRKDILKPGAPILVFDGKLRDSIISNTSDSILKITENSVIIGTSVIYAKDHDEGVPEINLPVRKPLFLTAKMIEQILKVYEAHIEKQLNKI